MLTFHNAGVEVIAEDDRPTTKVAYRYGDAIAHNANH
jgi:hypothetical protein